MFCLIAPFCIVFIVIFRIYLNTKNTTNVVWLSLFTYGIRATIFLTLKFLLSFSGVTPKQCLLYLSFLLHGVWTWICIYIDGYHDSYGTNQVEFIKLSFLEKEKSWLCLPAFISGVTLTTPSFLLLPKFLFQPPPKIWQLIQYQIQPI